MEDVDKYMYDMLLSIQPEEYTTAYPYNIKDSIEFTKNEIDLHYIDNYNKKLYAPHLSEQKGGKHVKPSKVTLYIY
jgi:hypothetical protein